MLYNIITGWAGIRKRSKDEIVIMASSLHEIKKRGIQFLFTDRHARLAARQFHSDLARLDQVDWPLLQRRDFKNDPDDPGKKERYQAEALIYKHAPIDALAGVVCYSDAVVGTINRHLATRNQTFKVVKKTDWYF